VEVPGAGGGERGEALAQELRLAELKLIYLQLQDFYRDAAHHNWAVLSVIQDKIRPEKLI